LLLIFTNSLFAQQKFEEKIGIGFSKLVLHSEYYNETNLYSRADLSAGIHFFNKNKGFVLRKELEAELFLIRGSDQSGALGGSYSKRNLKGYSLLSKFKLLPQVKIKQIYFLNAGPVIGRNFKAHWSYDYSYSDSFNPANNGKGHASESITDLFSKCFWGIEANVGGYKNLNNGNYFGWELGLIYYHSFFTEMVGSISTVMDSSFQF